jgi:hypothetical protein
MVMSSNLHFKCWLILVTQLMTNILGVVLSAGEYGGTFHDSTSSQALLPLTSITADDDDVNNRYYIFPTDWIDNFVNRFI